MSNRNDEQTTRSRGRDPALLPLRGGWLCFDFANSVDDRTSDHPRDTLTGYADLVRWGWHASMLTDDERDRLLDAAKERPAEAAAVFARAIELREAIYRVFAAIAEGAEPASADLAAIQNAHVAALGHARLTRDGGCYGWVWDDAPDLGRPLWPFAMSAVELLTTDRLNRVKQCPDRGCGWLFLDLSKNATRRWCSMEGCGSRAKMRRQYARRKGAAA
jgi:predicted RNA-binding Zn ribbon-like protein